MGKLWEIEAKKSQVNGRKLETHLLRDRITSRKCCRNFRVKNHVQVVLDSNFCVPSRDTVHHPLGELVVWQDRLNAVADVGPWELFDLTETIRHVFWELLVIHGEF